MWHHDNQIYLQSASGLYSATTDRGNRGRRKYTNLNISRTKKAFLAKYKEYFVIF